MLKFNCSEHGDQKLKDSLMMSDGRGLILELMCHCTFKLFRNGKNEITQRRLTFTQASPRSEDSETQASV
jgi:hypothetical protein